MKFTKKCYVAAALMVSLTASSVVFAGEAAAPEKNYNITINPLGLLFGSYAGDINYGIMEKATLGLMLGYYGYTLGTTTLSSFEFGLRFNYYLGGPRLTDGWYLSPEVAYAPFTFKNSVGSATLSDIPISLLIGYHWVYNSGFNMMLGGGVTYHTMSGTATVGGTATTVPAFTGILPALEFNLGYAF